MLKFVEIHLNNFILNLIKLLLSYCCLKFQKNFNKNNFLISIDDSVHIIIIPGVEVGTEL